MVIFSFVLLAKSMNSVATFYLIQHLYLSFVRYITVIEFLFQFFFFFFDGKYYSRRQFSFCVALLQGTRVICIAMSVKLLGSKPVCYGEFPM